MKVELTLAEKQALWIATHGHAKNEDLDSARLKLSVCLDTRHLESHVRIKELEREVARLRGVIAVESATWGRS